MDKVVLNWLILEKDKSRTLWYHNTNSGSCILVPFPVAGKFWEALYSESRKKCTVYLALDGNTVVSDGNTVICNMEQGGYLIILDPFS